MILRMSHMNLVYCMAAHYMRYSIAQWLEHPTGVRKVMGSNPVGDSDFFLCPTLVTN